LDLQNSPHNKSFGLKHLLKPDHKIDISQLLNSPKKVDFIKPKNRMFMTSNRDNFLGKSLQNREIRKMISEPTSVSLNVNNRSHLLK
jgi:hypothetical protein